MEIIEILLSYPNYLVLLSGFLAFIVSLKIYPAIIYLSQKKNLMDVPGERSTHSKKTPTLGGIGIFLAFALTLSLSSILLNFEQQDLIKMVALLGSTILLLFLGIKDDLLILSPRKKLGGQILVSTIVVILTDVRVFDFAGILGIGELSMLFSILFSILIYVFIINAFNLTDGIDGLSTSLAMIASAVFGIYFVLNGFTFLAFASFILLGALGCFLKFNTSRDQKIFMGDSGSMFVGFILAFLALSFIRTTQSDTLNFTFDHPVLIAMAVLSYPVMDTLRVFTVRILNGKSPFSADRRHIHHKISDLGFNHLFSTILICNANALLIATAFFLDITGWNINVQFIFLALMSFCLYLSPFYLQVKGRQVKVTWPKILNIDI